MKTKFFPYTLSIGMIVKNDAHTLRTCLEGLAPLRQAVSCELILTDLGSTDGTQEIAKEYADVFLEHEWSNDFSKARNTGVTAAKGRWFFYVDADYQFDESILDIATFLSDKKQSKIYNSATVTLENHVKSTEDHDSNTSSYYHTQRGILVNFSGGKRFFKGMTHESIPTYGVAYPLKTLITRLVEEDSQETKEQNLLLLEAQLKQEPDDLKHYIELAQALQDPEKKQAIYQEGLSKSKSLSTKNRDNVLWAAILHSRYLRFLLQEEDWDLFEVYEEKWNNPFPKSIIDLNVQGMGVSFALKQLDDDGLLERFSSYQSLFYQLKKTPDQIFSMIENFQHAREPFFYSVESNAIRCAVSLQRDDLAKEWLAQSDTYAFVHSNKTRAYLPDFCESAMNTEQFNLIRKAYDYLSTHGSPQDLALFLEEIELHYITLSGYLKPLFLEAMEGVTLSFVEKMETGGVASAPSQQMFEKFDMVPLETYQAPTEKEVLPSLDSLKQELLTLLQQGEVASATALLATARARFPEDPTLQALQETLGS